MSEHLTDATRSAVAIVRALMKGDASVMLALTAGMEDAELAALCGALAALATSSLHTVDAVVAYVHDAGYGLELSGQSSDLVLAGIQRQAG